MNIDELQAGHELDRLIAEKVMGHKVFRWGAPDDLFVASGREAFDYACNGDTLTCFAHTEKGFCFSMPSYSTDWGAVEVVLEHLSKLGFNISLFNRVVHMGLKLEKFNIGMWRDKTRVITASAETAPLAICRAALKARKDTSVAEAEGIND